MRRMCQRVVVARPDAGLHLAYLIADGDHGGDEAVDLGQGFALGRFHHQCARHRKAQRGRMETVVHQPLGNVFGADARGFFERAQIENAFMRHPAVVAGV